MSESLISIKLVLINSSAQFSLKPGSSYAGFELKKAKQELDKSGTEGLFKSSATEMGNMKKDTCKAICKIYFWI